MNVIENGNVDTKFSLLKIDDDPEGWGPTLVPEKFADLPFQPFSKDIKLGKIADWTSTYNPDTRKKNEKTNQLSAQANQYAYIHEEDESSFHMVNTVKDQKSNYLKQRNKYAANRTRREKVAQRQQQQLEQQSRLGLTKKQKFINRERQQDMRRLNRQHGRLNNASNYNTDYRRQNRIQREASVPVKDTWKVVEEIEFSRFNKLNLLLSQEPEDLYTCGEMRYYDKSFDRINVHNTTKLKLMSRLIHNITTREDPIIRKLVHEKAGTVYATDAVITTLMCCTRSVYSWDIIAQKIDNVIFLVQRPGNHNFNFVTVNETATEPPVDESNSINCSSSLSLEATFINHNFTQQVLQEKFYSFPNGNPFAEDEDKNHMGSIGYRYRRFNLGHNANLGGNINLVVRCEHDAVTERSTNFEESEVSDQVQFVTIRTLNEWDSRLSGGIDWRSKLDVQRGAILGAEIKNNSFKLAKWTLSALLSGSDQLKLGYVTRDNIKANNHHTILGMQQFKPTEFANQINLKMENAWGVLRSIIDILIKMDDGKYLIMRDPNKPFLRIYDVPNDAFEDEGEGDSDDADDDDDQ